MARSAGSIDIAKFLRRIESCGSVSYAARRLHLSRAAFCERIALLEAKAGGKLVSADTLMLTERGRRLMAGAPGKHGNTGVDAVTRTSTAHSKAARR